MILFLLLMFIFSLADVLLFAWALKYSPRGPLHLIPGSGYYTAWRKLRYRQ